MICFVHPEQNFLPKMNVSPNHNSVYLGLSTQ